MHKLTNNSDTPHHFTVGQNTYSAKAGGGSCEVKDEDVPALEKNPGFQAHMESGDIELIRDGEAPAKRGRPATIKTMDAE